MSDITTALTQLRHKQERCRKYSDYYAGRQRLAFATEKFRNAFGSLFEAFADNLCAVVVDTIADRLEVTGLGTESGGEAAAVDAWAIWQANRMDTRAGEVHQEALKAGEAYAIVWPDTAGRPTIYPQRAEWIACEYDEEQPGAILWAAKCWQARGKRIRLNLYYPDRIEKYITRQADGGLPESEGAFTALPEQPAVPNPWGAVPVFVFRNNAGIGEPGKSELRDVIPVQDALNKSVADMLVAGEFVALPQRWATGLEVETDPVTGRAKAPFVPGVDRVWAVASELVKFGEFAQADLTKLLAIQDNLRLEIMRLSGIPPHYVSLINNPPSGEALKTLEARFVKKCRDRQASYGNAWEDCLALALRMAGGAAARLSCEWADPAPVTTRESVEIATMKEGAGVSKRQALMEMGYTDAETEQMLQEAQTESESLGKRILAQFDRGE